MSDKIRYTFGKYRPNIIDINTKDMHYCIVELVEKRNKIDFDAISNISPRFCKNIVVSKDIILPEGLNIKSHKPKVLCNLLGLNGAIDILSKSRVPFVRRSMGLVDEAGIYMDFAEKMIINFPTVKVYTKNHTVYESFGEKMMELYGAPLLVGDCFDFLSDCNIIFYPEASEAEFYISSSFPPIICSQHINNKSNRNIFSLGDIEFPKEYINDITNCFDSMTFFDAAYSFCDTMRLVDSAVINYHDSSDCFTVDEMVKLVENRYKKSIY